MKVKAQSKYDPRITAIAYVSVIIDEPEEPNKEFSSTVYKITDNDIYKVMEETSITNFKKNIKSDLSYSIYKDGVVVQDEKTIIQTGMKLKLSTGKEYTLVVRGDINLDGKVTLVDLSKQILHFNETKGFILNGPAVKGADMNYDGTIFYYQTPEQLDAALGTGGAMTIFADNATIKNSNFTGGSARLGGGIYVGADSGSTQITNSIFKSNVAWERGGAVNLYASGVHIDQGQFYDNLAINGSALYVGGVGTQNKVHESIFSGNNATSYGGGIYWIAYEGEIRGSEFISNSAEYGGGIYLNGKSANTNITNTKFKFNNAVKNGGAIDCNATQMNLTNTLFESNYAGEYGAALCREANATGGHGKNNTFISNHAGISGAALAWLNVENININNYTFIDNTAERSGGAIYISDGSDNCVIFNSTFKGNHLTNMTEYHYGGAIDCVGDNLTVNMSSFENNGANTGGAIYVGTGSSQAHILASNFTSNYAYADGGAIGLKADTLIINESIFKSNTAIGSGGAVYVGGIGENNTIHYSVFEDNQAGNHGGAIDWLAKAGEIIHSNFTKNSAEYGGAVYLNGVSSKSRISDVIFKENTATENGGAIDCNATEMNLTHTKFISNTAKYGAGLCRESGATGGFGGNNTFDRNHAYVSGAALAWLDVDNIHINNYTFTNNTADFSGGAIYVSPDSHNCVVQNSTFYC